MELFLVCYPSVHVSVSLGNAGSCRLHPEYFRLLSEGEIQLGQRLNDSFFSPDPASEDSSEDFYFDSEEKTEATVTQPPTSSPFVAEKEKNPVGVEVSTNHPLLDFGLKVSF